MIENTNAQTAQTSNEATPEQVVPSLARGTAPALGKFDVNGNANTNENKDIKETKEPKVTQEPQEPVANEQEPENVSLEQEDDNIDGDKYVETPIQEVNELVAELKKRHIPYARANLLLNDAFSKVDASKLDKKAFEEVFGKEHSSVLYAYAKVAVAAIKSNREANAKELDSLAGGSWKNLVSKAQKMFTKEELKEYAELVNAGGAARKLAIREMIAKTSKKEDNKLLLTGDNVASTDEEALSKMEYHKQMNAIYDKYTRAGMLTEEGRMKMKQLDARRAASIRAGIN